MNTYLYCIEINKQLKNYTMRVKAKWSIREHITSGILSLEAIGLLHVLQYYKDGVSDIELAEKSDIHILFINELIDILLKHNLLEILED